MMCLICCVYRARQEIQTDSKCVIGFITLGMGMPTGNSSTDDCDSDYITLNYVANFSTCLIRQQQA